LQQYSKRSLKCRESGGDYTFRGRRRCHHNGTSDTRWCCRCCWHSWLRRSRPGKDGRLQRAEQGTFRIRQRPGPNNSLGLVKFVFPNDANVYMHGTPAQELFSRPRRDFSHGCIRVADPVGLAEWVLSDSPEWTRDRILGAMNGREPLRVNLVHQIRVILFYVTAVATPTDGGVRFVEDIYRHDARLDAYLTRRHES
jgi:hypothetical protein